MPPPYTKKGSKRESKGSDKNWKKKKPRRRNISFSTSMRIQMTRPFMFRELLPRMPRRMMTVSKRMSTAEMITGLKWNWRSITLCDRCGLPRMAISFLNRSRPCTNMLMTFLSLYLNRCADLNTFTNTNWPSTACTPLYRWAFRQMTSSSTWNGWVKSAFPKK